MIAKNRALFLRAAADASETFIRCPGEIDIAAAAEGAPANSPAKATIVAYRGGVMRVPGFGPVVVEMSGIKFPGEIPILGDHQNVLDSMAGSGFASVENGTVVVRGTISRASAAGSKAIGLAADKIKLSASIGLEVEESVRINPGATVTANGKQFTAGPEGLKYIKRGTLRETSITPAGADHTSTVSIAANASFPGGSDEQDIRASERARVREIESLCARSGGWGRDERRVNELRASAIDGAIEIQELQAGLLKILRAARPEMANGLTGAGAPSIPDVMKASLAMSMGATEATIGKYYGEGVMNAAMSREGRGATFQDVLRGALRAAGHPCEGKVDSTFIRAAFEADRYLQASGPSTFSIGGILSDAASKLLLQGYMAVKTTWRSFAKKGTAKNFKPQARYRLTLTGRFELVSAAGELKHGSMQEEKFGIQLGTYGKIIGITRQDFINDDLGAFTTLPIALGRSSAIAVERAAFIMLLSNAASFFSVGNKNLKTGAGSALSIDSLTAANRAMLEQLDENGDPCIIVPKTLLVAPELIDLADQLTRSTDVRQGPQSAVDDQYPTANPHAGKFSPQVSPFLATSSGLPNASDAGWYLFGDASDIAAFEICFLNDIENPVVESGDLSFDTLGLQMRAYHDFGVAFSDHRAAVFSAGE